MVPGPGGRGTDDRRALLGVRSRGPRRRGSGRRVGRRPGGGPGPRRGPHRPVSGKPVRDGEGAYDPRILRAETARKDRASARLAVARGKPKPPAARGVATAFGEAPAAARALGARAAGGRSPVGRDLGPERGARRLGDEPRGPGSRTSVAWCRPRDGGPPYPLVVPGERWTMGRASGPRFAEEGLEGPPHARGAVPPLRGDVGGPSGVVAGERWPAGVFLRPREGSRNTPGAGPLRR